MLRLLKLLPFILSRFFCSCGDLLWYNLGLRQQLVVVERRHSTSRFAAANRLSWVLLRPVWPGWRRNLILLQPEPVVCYEERVY
jgi:hypothetical protein